MNKISAKQLVNSVSRNISNFVQSTVKHPASLKLTNVKQVVGFTNKDELFTKQNCQILLKDGKIAKIADIIEEEADQTLNTYNSLVTPGFIDPHTHIFPPRDRAKEFSMRVNKTYEEIAAAGGGILNSAKAIKEESFEAIYERNQQNLKSYIKYGTTTLEMKSGYGLSTDQEIKLLRVINELKKDFEDEVEIVPTFLGAHAFPPEFKDNKDKYVDLICEEMIPEVAKHRLAEYCDVFCEKGYFDVHQSERILQTAHEHGMKVRLHADEFVDSGGAELAAKLKADSADHLMAVSDKGIKALAQSGVVATMLPGTTIFLGKQQFAPVRKMVDAGVRVAVATDFNPGSSVFNCQPMMWNFAMSYGKLTLEEAFKGVTRNAALALGRIDLGVINEGAQADLIVWKQIDSLDQIPYYHYESAKFRMHSIKKGRLVNE